ncbi:MAG: FtsX-like permease family protein [Euryarchaeota archaeon]|nr:FtsX-like permease family protein [Euryarchaeota archaeon]
MFEKFRVSLFLAYKYLTGGNKGITIFTIFILTLVFLQLVLVSAILGGATNRFNELMIDYQTGNVVIEPKEDTEYISDAHRLMSKINALPEVTGVSARIKGVGKIIYEDRSVGATVIGIDPLDENTVTKVNSAIVDGDFISKLDSGEIVLGREISGGYGALMESKSLGGVKVGDRVNLRIGSVDREFRVKGIYTTLFFLVDSSAYINKKDMEDILGVQDEAHEIAIKLNHREDEEEFRKKLMGIGINEEIRVWREFAGIVELLTRTITQIGNILNLIGLLIAFVIIFIVIYINTINKRRQIGVQKAIGIGSNVIVASFVLQAIFYASFGMFLGFFAMQYLITPYTITHPIQLPVGPVILSLSNTEALFRAALLFFATILASFIPAYKVAREDLLELIWG